MPPGSLAFKLVFVLVAFIFEFVVFVVFEVFVMVVVSVAVVVVVVVVAVAVGAVVVVVVVVSVIEVVAGGPGDEVAGPVVVDVDVDGVVFADILLITGNSVSLKRQLILLENVSLIGCGYVS